MLMRAAHSVPSLDAGGIAGGVKYLVNDIFFKVSSDEHGLYGSYQYAQKAALLYASLACLYMKRQLRFPSLQRIQWAYGVA